MTEVFSTVLAMSGYGLVAALLAWAVTRLLGRTRCSKTALLLLWLAAAFRLLCPWSPSSPLSIYNLAPTTAEQAAPAPAEPDTGTDPAALPSAPAGAGAEHSRPLTGEAAGGETAAPRPLTAMAVLPWVWLTGAAALLLFGAGSYALLRRRLRFAVRDGDSPDLWYSDRISSPCVAGLLRPRIYLTFGMDSGQQRCVLAHERQHIRAGDHLWKVLAWLIMCLHWFNPLLWLCYRAFLRSVEEACDQRALRQLGEENKADYGQALLSLSGGRRFALGPSPIAFGEGATKGRVKVILRYKKPLALLTAGALVLAAAAAATVLTSRVDAPGVEDSINEALGTYQVTGLIRQPVSSSISGDLFLEPYLGGQAVLSVDRFSLSWEGPAIENAVYQPLELGDTLPVIDTGDAAFDSTLAVDLTGYETVKGWQVLGQDGAATDYHIFYVDGRLWVARWQSHGSGTYRECAYILEAAKPENAGTASGPLTGETAYWELDLRLSSLSAFPFSLRAAGFDRAEVTCDHGSLANTTGSGVLTVSSGQSLSLSHGDSFGWVPDGAERATVSFTLYRQDEAILTGALLIQAESATDTAVSYSARASLSDSTHFTFTTDPEGGGVIFGEPESESFGFTAVVEEVTGAQLTVRPEQSLSHSLDANSLYAISVSDFLDMGYAPGDRVYVVAQGPVQESYPARFSNVLNVVPLSHPLALWSADLTGDGAEETIQVTGGEGGIYYLTVLSGAKNVLYSGEAGVSHVGQNGYYLCEIEGRHYLLQWISYMQSGQADYTYQLFTLTEDGRQQIVQSDDLIFCLDEVWADAEAIRAFDGQINELLERSSILLSTNGDAPAGVYYGNPDDPVYPALPWDSGADQFEALQSLAQGTYTFTGEVAGVWDTYIMVEDQSLFTTAGMMQYVFTLPVEDASRFQAGDAVSVTADGPIYRWSMPDAGVTVTVESADGGRSTVTMP